MFYWAWANIHDCHFERYSDSYMQMMKMEEEIKTMQKHMAGMVRTIIDLKSK